MTKTRTEIMGKKILKTVDAKKPAKSNQIKLGETYTGEISRAYRDLPRFLVTENGKRGFIMTSKKSLHALQNRHPEWTIKQLPSENEMRKLGVEF